MKRILPLALFLLPVAVLLFVLRDVVFFGKFFYSGDVTLGILPFFFYHAHNGALIVQEMFSGFPLFVSINADWFYPVSTFLFAHFSATSAYVLWDVGNVLLAYFFTYLYARKVGLGLHAATLAAMTFVFSGQLMLWLPATSMTGYYFLLPATLYLFELALTKSLWTRTVLLAALGAFLGLGWVGSHVQFVVYIHTFYFVYVLMRLWLIEKIRPWWQTFVALAVPYAVSFAVGLPQILAVISFQQETLRSNGVGLSASAGTGYLPWDFLHYVLPFWNVSFLTVTSPNLYIGILPMMLLFITLYVYRHLVHPFASLYLGLFLFCLAAALYYSPLGILLHYLPMFNSFREAPRIMFMGGFAEAMLVGIGFDYILANWRDVDFYRLRPMRIFTALFLYAVLPVVVVFSLVRAFYFKTIEARLDQYFLAHKYVSTTQLPKEHYLTVINTYLHQALDQFSLYDPQLLFALFFILVSLALFKFQKHILPRHLGAAVIIITSLNFACVFAAQYPSIPSAAVTDPSQTVLAIRALQQNDPAPFRVFSIFPAQSIYNDTVACPLTNEETVQMQNELIEPNSNVYQGIDSAEGYDNFMPLRISEGINYIGSASTGASDPLFLRRTPLEQKIQIILARKNVLRSMNIKYITSAAPLTDPALHLVSSTAVGTCKHPVYLYALEGTWPRYFVTNTVALSKVTNTEDASSTLGELNHYATPTVLLDSSTPLVPFVGKSKTTELLPNLGYNTLAFDTPACVGSCTLFVGNAYLRGWSATVDGKPSSILRANYQYMAVLLPPGAHRVVLTYKKPL